jgi:hypothetical protein
MNTGAGGITSAQNGGFNTIASARQESSTSGANTVLAATSSAILAFASTKLF